MVSSEHRRHRHLFLKISCKGPRHKTRHSPSTRHPPQAACHCWLTIGAVWRAAPDATKHRIMSKTYDQCQCLYSALISKCCSSKSAVLKIFLHQSTIEVKQHNEATYSQLYLFVSHTDCVAIFNRHLKTLLFTAAYGVADN